MSIGGLLSDADKLLILKDLNSRLSALEEKANEAEATVPRTRDSKVSKRKTTSSRVSAKSDDA
jgi:hypothetical protein